MGKFLLRRIRFLIGTLFVVSVLSFLLPYASKGNAAETILRTRTGDVNPNPAEAAVLSHQLGLDQPLPFQYWHWLDRAVRGDLGLSFTSQQPVGPMLGHALVVSVTLSSIALALAFVVGVPLGIVSARYSSKLIDTIITTTTQSFVPLPEYWLAPMFILVFSIWLRFLPSAGWGSYRDIVLPACVLALRPLAYLTAVARASMVDVIDAPYMGAARARGLSRRQALLAHGVRNAAPPVITLAAAWFPYLLGGSVIVEVVYAIPGMGQLLYEAVVNGDVPVIQGAMLVIVLVAMVISTLIDVIYSALNPAVSLASA
jgi:peptide/nickel transport system permease protein